MISRRTVLTSGALLAVPSKTAPPDRHVHFTGDGLSLKPLEYSRLLAQLAEEDKIKPDSYSNDGIVAELEQTFAADLGKERAVFLPTGTLANHLAVRLLAGNDRKVLVQRESHLYNDEGDCAQTLSGLTLVPLAADRATFTLDEVQEHVRRAEGGRVAAPVGVISIESPVRRKSGELFDYAEMKRIAAFARERGIRLHLDGARLYLASAYTRVPPAEYASLYDTVYVSLYKYFNAASGAILAGPRKLLDPLYHTRRMFGGGLNQVWPFAAVALHYHHGFYQRYQAAVRASEDLLHRLSADHRFRIERIPNGSNIVVLQIRTTDPKTFQKKLAAAGVTVRAPESGKVLLTINETITRRSTEELAALLQQAAG
ncbi:MAG: aminotransferase class I/II-fold pyridoxal phosphate-dependent enzyme [Acidobacteria bacterium]|nr:aminotransferase class I/II-fold pyridoxal phosphate-dependent enzyme [Acidobacteriota bacterium]